MMKIRESGDGLFVSTGRSWRPADAFRSEQAPPPVDRAEPYLLDDTDLAQTPLAQELETLEQWRALSSHVRGELLESIGSYPTKYPSVASTGRRPLSELPEGPVRDFALRMYEHMKDTAEFTVFEPFPTVGPTQVAAEVYLLPTGEILGGYVRLRQEGCFMDGQEHGHFETWSDARGAGGQEGEVSWVMRGTFDHSMAPVRSDPAWEWAGL